MNTSSSSPAGDSTGVGIGGLKVGKDIPKAGNKMREWVRKNKHGISIHVYNQSHKVRDWQDIVNIWIDHWSPILRYYISESGVK